MADNRIWLDVAFAEKDEAKAQGAEWDPTARPWYAPRPGMTALIAGRHGRTCRICFPVASILMPRLI